MAAELRTGCGSEAGCCTASRCGSRGRARARCSCVVGREDPIGQLRCEFGVGLSLKNACAGVRTKKVFEVKPRPVSSSPEIPRRDPTSVRPRLRYHLNVGKVQYHFRNFAHSGHSKVQSPSNPCRVCGARQLKLGVSSRHPSLGLISWRSAEARGTLLHLVHHNEGDFQTPKSSLPLPL